jgi:hypothetical protein
LLPVFGGGMEIHYEKSFNVYFSRCCAGKRMLRQNKHKKGGHK